MNLNRTFGVASIYTGRGTYICFSCMFLKAVLRIRDVYPGSCFFPSRIQKQQKRDKEFFCLNYLSSRKFHKITMLSEIWV
jgi:hypothetical protein